MFSLSVFGGGWWREVASGQAGVKAALLAARRAGVAQQFLLVTPNGRRRIGVTAGGECYRHSWDR